jgi:hypothetical protein
MKGQFLVLVLFLMSSLAMAQKYENFGAKVKNKNVGSVNTLKGKESFASSNVKVVGEVESVCQAKGCWMKLKLDDGSTMRVTFKDYGFFVPKDIAGQKVIIEGKPEVKTTSIDELKHYAEDAGKSKEEIAKITEPKKELTFLASGVLVPVK